MRTAQEPERTIEMGASHFLACLEETSENSPGFQAWERVDMRTQVPKGRPKSLGCTGYPQKSRYSRLKRFPVTWLSMATWLFPQ